MASITDITTKNRHQWRIVALVAALVNALLGVIELGLAGGSGISGVYIISAVLIANAFILWALARYLSPRASS